MSLSEHLEENVQHLKAALPLGVSFDFMTRDLLFGKTRAYFLGVNGFCKTEILQQIFSDLQNPLYMEDNLVEDLQTYIRARLGYAQTSLSDSWEEIIRAVLSGPSALFVDGFDHAVLIDVRTYPTRGMAEPDLEKVTRGSRDGFVETLLLNANLIRRRVRSPRLCFSMHSVGTESRTDVAIADRKSVV